MAQEQKQGQRSLSIKTGQTGPKSSAGKKISAQNSRKSAIFAKGYLPWEDIEQKQLMHEQLCEQWQAYDPTRLILLRTIEQSHLELERIMFVQKQKIEAAMQSLDIAKKFCQLANFGMFDEASIPTWYFSSDSGEEKEHAELLLKISQQAKHLENDCDQSNANQIELKYPELNQFVQGTNVSKPLFEVLEELFNQGTHKKNLFEFVRNLEGRYRYYLKWAKDAKRYQAIIDGIRAQLSFEAMDLDKSTRYATTIQNRILKGIHGLVALGQVDATHQIHHIETP